MDSWFLDRLKCVRAVRQPSSGGTVDIALTERCFEGSEATNL